jgi:hypothetical protein
MKKLYIFGDSFSTHYGIDNDFRSDKAIFAKKYYSLEKENGYNGDYQDLNYFFKKHLGSNFEIFNSAEPGNSNQTIINDFIRESSNFKEGDYVSFQTSHYNRFNVVNNKDNKFISVVPNHFPTHFYSDINFNKNELEKLCYEYSHDLYYDINVEYVNFIKKFLELSKVNYYIWTIEKRLEHLNTVKKTLNEDLFISRKFNSYHDQHPSFEGNEFIVNNIVNYWGIQNGG